MSSRSEASRRAWGGAHRHGRASAEQSLEATSVKIRTTSLIGLWNHTYRTRKSRIWKFRQFGSSAVQRMIEWSDLIRFPKAVLVRNLKCAFLQRLYGQGFSESWVLRVLGCCKGLSKYFYISNLYIHDYKFIIKTDEGVAIVWWLSSLL
jgi:hypothetical protein